MSTLVAVHQEDLRMNSRANERKMMLPKHNSKDFKQSTIAYFEVDKAADSDLFERLKRKHCQALKPIARQFQTTNRIH